MTTDDELMTFIDSYAPELRDTECHGILHIANVWNSAMVIAMVQGLSQNEMTLLKIAVVMHDITRHQKYIDEKGIDDHHISGAAKAREVLYDKRFNQDEIDIVADAILCHRSSVKSEPKSLVGAILRDADKMDAIGYRGIYRSLVYSANHDIKFFDPDVLPNEVYNGKYTTTVNHMIEKLIPMWKNIKWMTSGAQFESKKECQIMFDFLEGTIMSSIPMNHSNREQWVKILSGLMS